MVWYGNLNLTRDEIIRAEKRQKAIDDYNAFLGEALEKGEAKALSKGLSEDYVKEYARIFAEKFMEFFFDDRAESYAESYANAYIEGFAIGLEKGIVSEKISSISKLRKLNLTESEIIDFIGEDYAYLLNESSNRVL